MNFYHLETCIPCIFRRHAAGDVRLSGPLAARVANRIAPNKLADHGEKGRQVQCCSTMYCCQYGESPSRVGLFRGAAIPGEAFFFASL